MEANRKALRFFSALSDETRLNIVMSLTKKPMTVCEIHEALGGHRRMTLSAISHQLKYLEALDVLVFEKRGREKHYKLSDGFCWCILRDVDNHFGKKTRCKACAGISKGNSCCK